jgi:hypothetical protein
MEKKLYRVKVVLYVMAENESEACLAAANAHFDIFECNARKAEHLDPGWDNAIPYNSDSYRTCAEILASQQQTSYTAAQFQAISAQRPARIRAVSDTPQALSFPG